MAARPSRPARSCCRADARAWIRSTTCPVTDAAAGRAPSGSSPRCPRGEPADTLPACEAPPRAAAAARAAGERRPIVRAPARRASRAPGELIASVSRSSGHSTGPEASTVAGAATSATRMPPRSVACVENPSRAKRVATMRAASGTPAPAASADSRTRSAARLTKLLVASRSTSRRVDASTASPPSRRTCGPASTGANSAARRLPAARRCGATRRAARA